MKKYFKDFMLLIFTANLSPAFAQYYTNQPYINAVGSGGFNMGYNNGMNMINPIGANRQIMLGENQNDECIPVNRYDTTDVKNRNDLPVPPPGGPMGHQH